ncbi:MULTISPECIES: acetamidase/formamidase family protein [Thermomonosporaceae]|uniref:acetamidase/formamidase family protein n=1 Tax=Thermomonosporaceae TaxID=2012 RepID=UPI00255B2DD2|nr:MULTISPECIES: acetamidase/formamidase family protein [Thermomonosporaceae]MDL4774414.1 acetamidase/formamidase family protein [Actinomadura xylanilytica]
MHFRRTSAHNAWDNAIPPLAVLAPGEEITLETAESSGGQLGRDSVTAEVADLDFGRVNPVTGPFRIEGAEPGDALVIDVLEVEVGDWGWTACIPGFGLLADQFPDPHLRISTIGADGAELLPGLPVPVVPMIGTIGTAPPEPGEHSIVPPRRWGGNLDVRHIGPGARLILPVGVEGALLSVGDAHAAMGDGEVCGTGVETDAAVRLRVGLHRGGAPRTPVVHTDPRSQRTGAALATTGIGPDLMEATRDAARRLIDEVVARTGMHPVDAYLLASVAADLKISEVVDAPNWVVSAHLEFALLS